MKIFMPYRYLAVILLALCHAAAAQTERLPRPDHIVVVIEENRSFNQIMGRPKTPYIHALAKRGVLFTQSYGVSYPSQPNYLALFSGSTQGVNSDHCPYTFSSDNLATALMEAGLSFTSFAESLPEEGDLACEYESYQRKHNPASNWQLKRLPDTVNRRFADFPKDFSKLPTVSFVIPNQDNDMHDGSSATADQWLKNNLGAYVEWAMKHNSLLVLTWDEDNYQEGNHITTIMAGPMVKSGESDQRIDHYSVLRTLLDFYGLPALGASADAEPITGVWKKR